MVVLDVGFHFINISSCHDLVSLAVIDKEVVGYFLIAADLSFNPSVEDPDASTLLIQVLPILDFLR